MHSFLTPDNHLTRDNAAASATKGHSIVRLSLISTDLIALIGCVARMVSLAAKLSIPKCRLTLARCMRWLAERVTFREWAETGTRFKNESRYWNILFTGKINMGSHIYYLQLCLQAQPETSVETADATSSELDGYLLMP